MMQRSMLLAALISASAGSSALSETASEYPERVVPDMPRGSLGLPANWSEMESFGGWEEMMLISGYADNPATRNALQ